MSRAPFAERGFTLIEMLVALAIFAIAAMALMRLDIYAITQTGALGDSRLASLVAQNEAALGDRPASLTNTLDRAHAGVRSTSSAASRPPTSASSGPSRSPRATGAAAQS